MHIGHEVQIVAIVNAVCTHVSGIPGSAGLPAARRQVSRCWHGSGPGAAPSGRLPWGRPRRSCRRSEEHTSELQSLMRISYAVFCLKKKKNTKNITNIMNIDMIQ